MIWQDSEQRVLFFVCLFACLFLGVEAWRRRGKCSLKKLNLEIFYQSNSVGGGSKSRRVCLILSGFKLGKGKRKSTLFYKRSEEYYSESVLFPTVLTDYYSKTF